MYINVGAYVDEGTMIDSHALVGSCAQIGKRVHLSAAAQIGGVLEPINANPVVIEDDVELGAHTCVDRAALGIRRAVLPLGESGRFIELAEPLGENSAVGRSLAKFGEGVRRFEARNRSNMLLALGDNDYTESPSAFHRNWTASFGWLGSAGLRVAGSLRGSGRSPVPSA